MLFLKKTGLKPTLQDVMANLLLIPLKHGNFSYMVSITVKLNSKEPVNLLSVQDPIEILKMLPPGVPILTTTILMKLKKPLNFL